jgi:GNAT superfamily N-acetyltransferase
MNIVRIKGSEASPYLDRLGRLRIAVFKDFPYLYEGDLDYERKYLSTYAHQPESHLTLVFDGVDLVGATTAILAVHEEEAFKEPFRLHGLAPEEICYFGESILLPKYRGRGLGKTFMEDRLAFAKSFRQIKFASFCAVIRPAEHPMRPKDYKPLDEFWRAVGFSPVPGLTAAYKWRDIGAVDETEKRLQFWLKTL